MPEPIEIRTDERVFSTGRTGSGKTFLARDLLRPAERLVVLDPKGTLEPWRLHPWCKECRRLLRNGEPVRTRALLEPGQDPQAFWDAVLRECYEAGNVTVYNDEAYALTPNGQGWPPYLFSIYTRGRELGIGAWSASQRPAFVPRFLMSEAEHVFAFRLLLEDDRHTLAGNTHPGLAEEIPSGNPHGFRYWNVTRDTPVFYPRWETERGEGLGDLGNLLDDREDKEERSP